MDPVTYPVVHLPVIGDPNKSEPFTVCFTVDAIGLLKTQWQIDLFEPQKLDGAMANLEHACRLLSAGISHQAQISVEDLRKRVNLLILPDISAAISQAISKASPQVATPETTSTQIQ
jgi:hypothetical protein